MADPGRSVARFDNGFRVVIEGCMADVFRVRDGWWWGIDAFAAPRWSETPFRTAWGAASAFVEECRK